MLQIMFSGLFSSFLASLGFGILFNIKGKNLILAGLVELLVEWFINLCYFLEAVK